MRSGPTPEKVLERNQLMNVRTEVLNLLDEALSLRGRAAAFSDDTALLGSVPELDSMAVMAVITGIEERFGVTVEDDDISGATFASVGTRWRSSVEAQRVT